MHIAPSGSPQPTKQAFICKLYSGFPRIFSQQKPHRRICIPQGARNEVLQETQPETSNHFSVMFFRKTRKMSADVQAYFKRNLTPYSEKPARTSNPFSVMFFRKTRKISDGVLSVLRAKFDAVFGKLSPEPQHIFRRCFFRKTRKISAAVQACSERNLTPYSGNSARNLKSFFGDVFSQDKASKPPPYIHTARRKKRRIAEKQPEKSDFHNVGFLFLCHIVNFFNVFVGYLLNFVLTVVELVFGYRFIFVELF